MYKSGATTFQRAFLAGDTSVGPPEQQHQLRSRASGGLEPPPGGMPQTTAVGREERPGVRVARVPRRVAGGGLENGGR